jgi:hypothetical protein
MAAASGLRLPLLLGAMIPYGVSRLFQRESLCYALVVDFLKEKRVPQASRMSAIGAKRTFPVPTLRGDPVSRELSIRDIVGSDRG